MRVTDAIEIISEFYSIDTLVIQKFIDENSYKEPELSKEKIILPFCGEINYDCCKGVVFNHGLYTQCNKKIKDGYCKPCSKLKYGNIFERQKCGIGNFKTSEGKKEMDYLKFVKKMNYDIKYVIYSLKEHNLTHPIMNINLDSKDVTSNLKRGRGRPKKAEKLEEEDADLEDTIEVVKVYINNILYYKTRENVLLDNETHTIIGLYKDGSIVKI
jgi:hypothetical protein